MSPFASPVVIAWIGVTLAVLTTVATVALSYGSLKGKVESVRVILEHHIRFDHGHQHHSGD